MRKRILLIFLAVAAAGAGVYAIHENGRGPDDRIVVSGNIELTEINIGFKTAGRLIERDVDEGDSVRKDQIVARLDRDQLAAQRTREGAGLNSAEAQLAEALTTLEYQKATLASDVDARRADLAAAEAKLAELQNGSRPQEKQDAKAAVDSAQSEVARSKADWDRAQTLFKNDDISRAQFDQFRRNWETATAALRSATERQDMVLVGPRVEEIDGQIAQVAHARAALKTAEASALQVKQREEDLAARRADIAHSRASLALIDWQLSDTVAASPVDGVVLVKSADVGEILAPGTTVVTIGDIDHPWLRGYINETDLGKVRIGSKARVTTDSYPGKVFNGRVSFIASEAEFTPKQIQTQQERVKLVYRIKIDVENPGRALKSNMPADAEILLEGAK